MLTMPNTTGFFPFDTFMSLLAQHQGCHESKVKYSNVFTPTQRRGVPHHPLLWSNGNKFSVFQNSTKLTTSNFLDEGGHRCAIAKRGRPQRTAGLSRLFNESNHHNLGIEVFYATRQHLFSHFRPSGYSTAAPFIHHTLHPLPSTFTIYTSNDMQTKTIAPLHRTEYSVYVDSGLRSFRSPHSSPLNWSQRRLRVEGLYDFALHHPRSEMTSPDRGEGLNKPKGRPLPLDITPDEWESPNASSRRPLGLGPRVRAYE